MDRNGKDGISSSPAIKAVVEATKKRDPITKHMYGALIEHIGGLINYSLWAEVLEDRKFFYAVDDEPEAVLKWRPLGPSNAVTMDTTSPYVGDQSPLVTLAGSEPRGLRQDGLSLAAKDYVGRIVIAGHPGARVVVTLVWGEGGDHRQSVDVRVGSEWATIPLTFTCGDSTTEGRLEIAGTGTGSFRIGAVSLMPADNVQGFRKDTIELLRAIDTGVWRLPGGNFVSGHDWQDAIGDPDQRPPIWDDAWRRLQPNDVGTDELLAMCDLLGVEPFLCVNSGYGSAREAAEMVEYVNGSADTPMGRMRASNGHPEPYNVKYWNIGNEMYGYWQLGCMAPEHYMIKHNLFAKAMRKVDQSITLIAIGAMPDELTIDECSQYIDPHTREVVGDPVVVEYGSPTDWNFRLIQQCYGNFDIISEHCYGDAHRFDLALGKIRNEEVTESVLDSCRRAPNRVRLKREYWELYTKDFPQLERDQIKLSIDEWGFRHARGLKQTLGLAMTLHELFRCTDFITMAGFTMGTSWISHSRTDAVYSNAGMLFLMYRRHFGTIPVEVDGNSPQPPPKWPVGGDQPRVNAGSPTYPLDIAAALTEDGTTLTVAAVNATADAQRTSLDLVGFNPTDDGRRWRLTGPSLDASNLVGQPQQVTVEESAFNAVEGALSVAPYSIELYSFSKA